MSTSRLPLDGNRNLLAQGIELLERIDDELYARPRGTWAPVGAQYRHMLEHYQSFLQGLPARRVDYDARARDPNIERSRSAALDATRDVLAALACINSDEDPALQIQMDCGSGECGDWRASSVGRELQFLCSHTVHHFALIKLLLDGTGVELAPEFGVAPSTLAYHRAALR
jgi:uncharacterized damage-inducible protein DinB